MKKIICFVLIFVMLFTTNFTEVLPVLASSNNSLNMIWYEEFNDAEKTNYSNDFNLNNGAFTITTNEDGTATFSTSTSGWVYSKAYRSDCDKFIVEAKVVSMTAPTSDSTVGTDKTATQVSTPGVYYTVVDRTQGKVDFYGNTGTKISAQTVNFGSNRLFGMYLSKAKTITFDYIRVYSVNSTISLSEATVEGNDVVVTINAPISANNAVFTATPEAGDGIDSTAVSIISISEGKYRVSFPSLAAGTTYTLSGKSVSGLDGTAITEITSMSFSTPAVPITTNNMFYDDFNTVNTNLYNLRSGGSSLTTYGDGAALFTINTNWSGLYTKAYNTTSGYNTYLIEMKIDEISYADNNKKNFNIGTEGCLCDTSITTPGTYSVLVDKLSKKAYFFDDAGSMFEQKTTASFGDGRAVALSGNDGVSAVIDYIKVYTLGNSTSIVVQNADIYGIDIKLDMPIDISTAKFYLSREGENDIVSTSVGVKSFAENIYSICFENPIEIGVSYFLEVDCLKTIAGNDILFLPVETVVEASSAPARGRLLMNENGIAGISNNACCSYVNIWQILRNDVNSLPDTPPVYYEADNTEDTWMRDVADDIFKLTLAYKISGNSIYSEKAWNYVSGVISYPSWGRGEYLNNDLACAHFLVAISVYYDWFYDELSAEQKDVVLNVLIEKSQIMKNGGWWRASYLQNHSWICAASLAVTAGAIKEDNEELSTELFTNAKSIYDNVFNFVNDDGSYHEGHMYMSYGLEYMLLYSNVAKTFFNVDVSETPFINNAGEFLINLTLPVMSNNSGTDCFNFADAPAFGEDSFIPVLAQIADFTSQSNLWDYIELYANNNTRHISDWKLLMFYNPAESSVESTQEFENDKLYSETGYVFSRTGRTTNDTHFAFKCGAPLGTTAIGYGLSNLGTGHVHPDQNSFMLVYNGNRIFTDNGYAKAYTRDHNTLTINGAGQYYEGSDHSDWQTSDAKYANPSIKVFESCEDYLYAVGDATESYEQNSRLQKYERHFVFLKPDVLVVLDNANLKWLSLNSELKTNFFTPLTYSETNSDGSFSFQNSDVKMNVFTVGNGSASVQNLDRTISKNGTTESQTAFVVERNGKNLLNATAFSLSNSEETPQNVEMTIANGVLEIRLSSDSEAYYRVNYEENTIEKLYYNVQATKGDIVDTLDGAQASFGLQNNTDSSKTVLVILTAYDGEIFEKATIDRITLNKNEKFDSIITLTGVQKPDSKTIRLFIWTDNLVPLL